MNKLVDLPELGGLVWRPTYDWFQKLDKDEDILSMSEREIGDELVSERRRYTHHGIYIGDNKVIHYSGFASGVKKRGKIEIVSLDKFRNGKKTWVRRYRSPKYEGQKVVERAKSRLGEDLYDILLNNCEHFTTWCILGIHYSKQVNGGKSLSQMLEIGKQIRKPKEYAPRTKMPMPTTVTTNKPIELGGDVFSTVGKIATQTATVSTMAKLAAGASSVAMPVAVAYTAYEMAKNSDELADLGRGVVDSTTEVLGDVVDGAGEAIDTVVTGALDFLGSIFD